MATGWSVPGTSAQPDSMVVSRDQPSSGSVSFSPQKGGLHRALALPAVGAGNGDEVLPQGQATPSMDGASSSDHVAVLEAEHEVAQLRLEVAQSRLQLLKAQKRSDPVAYTPLTLPTNREV